MPGIRSGHSYESERLFQIMCCINAGCNQSSPPTPTVSTFFFFLFSLQLLFQGIFWLGAMSSLNVCEPWDKTQMIAFLKCLWLLDWPLRQAWPQCQVSVRDDKPERFPDASEGRWNLRKHNFHLSTFHIRKVRFWMEKQLFQGHRGIPARMGQNTHFLDFSLQLC